jgi:hypothetical protein
VAITAVIAAGVTSIKVKGRMGIRDATANDNPVKILALIGDQDSSDVSPTSSPIVCSDLNFISEVTLLAIASASLFLNPFL